MSKLLIALISTAFAGIAAAQTAAPAVEPQPTDPAAARRAASSSNVEKATEDKGHTQRAGEAAAKASGTGMSDEAKTARQKASRQNIKGATAGTEKGYTQSAGDAAAKASGTGMSDDAKAKRRAASKENVKKATEDKGHTQRAGEAAAKAGEEAKAAPK